MKTLKWFVVALVAFVLFVLLSPIFIVLNIIFRIFSKKYDLWYYFNAIAVGIDDLGASVIYGSKRHTISAITGHKAYQGDIWHKAQEKFINFLLRDNKHCYNEAVYEGLIKIER